MMHNSSLHHALPVADGTDCSVSMEVKVTFCVMLMRSLLEAIAAQVKGQLHISPSQ